MKVEDKFFYITTSGLVCTIRHLKIESVSKMGVVVEKIDNYKVIPKATSGKIIERLPIRDKISGMLFEEVEKILTQQEKIKKEIVELILG